MGDAFLGTAAPAGNKARKNGRHWQSTGGGRKFVHLKATITKQELGRVEILRKGSTSSKQKKNRVLSQGKGGSMGRGKQIELPRLS